MGGDDPDRPLPELRWRVRFILAGQHIPGCGIPLAREPRRPSAEQRDDGDDGVGLEPVPLAASALGVDEAEGREVGIHKRRPLRGPVELLGPSIGALLRQGIEEVEPEFGGEAFERAPVAGLKREADQRGA